MIIGLFLISSIPVLCTSIFILGLLYLGKKFPGGYDHENTASFFTHIALLLVGTFVLMVVVISLGFAFSSPAIGLQVFARQVVLEALVLGCLAVVLAVVAAFLWIRYLKKRARQVEAAENKQSSE